MKETKRSFSEVVLKQMEARHCEAAYGCLLSDTSLWLILRMEFEFHDLQTSLKNRSLHNIQSRPFQVMVPCYKYDLELKFNKALRV